MLSQSLAASPVAAAAAAAGVAATTLAALPLSPGPCRLGWSQEVFGHRGCRFVPGIPENSLRAFEYAADNGATGVEFDVRLCGTGDLVVFHDDRLRPEVNSRLVDGVVQPLSGNPAVKDESLSGIRSLRFTADPDKTSSIPTLGEALDFCRARGLKVLIEAKHFAIGGSAQFAAALARAFDDGDAWLRQNTTVISFNPLLLYLLRWRCPTVATCILHYETVLSDSAKAGSDSPPPAWPRLAGGIGRLLDWPWHVLCERVVPWLCGASMVGMQKANFVEAVHRRHNGAGRLVYLWDVTAPDGHIASTGGVTVGTDDEHNELLFPQKPSPFQPAA